MSSDLHGREMFQLDGITQLRKRSSVGGLAQQRPRTDPQVIEDLEKPVDFNLGNRQRSRMTPAVAGCPTPLRHPRA